jgi:hypothetical protein
MSIRAAGNASRTCALPAPRTQVLFYTLDTPPILLCFAAFILWHPGWYLAPRQEALPGKDCEEAANGADPSPSEEKEGQPGDAASLA